MAAAALAAVAIAGCQGGSHPHAGPSGSSGPSGPTGTPSATSGVSLQRLAAAGARLSYHAVYTARQRRPRSQATWTVWRRAHALRVDVVTGHRRGTFIVTAAASYACRATGRHRTCFRLPRRGRAVPAPLRLLAGQLFSTDLVSLADHYGRYTVSPTPVGAGAGALPAAGCFAVAPAAGTGTTGLARATYCFSSDGVLTSVRYPSGNSVVLASVTLQAPGTAAFRPYAHPTPLH